MTMLRLPRPHVKLPLRRTGSRKRDEQVLSRGQIIVVFALSLTVLIGIMGLAIDISYAWICEMRMQKAADAAALAGAVYLPDQTGPATTASLAEAVQNGYTNNVAGVVINAARDEPNHQQMDVTISAPIPTFFMRIFGVTSLASSRTAHAQYNLPLPMGSPLNVFGDPTATDLQGNALNFWAAIQGPCTLKENGDPYATKDTTSVHSNCSAVTSPSNTEYKPPTPGDNGAYDYSVKIPPGGGGTLSIQLYDPEFCQRSDQGNDTGDSAFTNQSSVDFNTVFTLYNQSSTPYDLSDDTVITTVSYPGDGDTNTGDGQEGKTHSCSPYYVHTDSVTHDDAAGGTGSVCYPAGPCGAANPWIQFATLGVTPGSYRINVQTTTVGTSPADGSNMFAIRATSSADASHQPQVFGGTVGTQSTMSIFNNLQVGTSYIYLAQIDSTNAGKTLVVDLYDPGDLNGTGVMYFEEPTTTGYMDDQFTWRDSGTTLNASGTQSGTVSSVTTSYSSTNHPFNGHWLVVTIPIDPTYTAPQNGWWKVKYVITGGAAHDRTTWTARVQNSPVHLVP
jgi:hypothetical protein